MASTEDGSVARTEDGSLASTEDGSVARTEAGSLASTERGSVASAEGASWLSTEVGSSPRIRDCTAGRSPDSTWARDLDGRVTRTVPRAEGVSLVSSRARTAGGSEPARAGWGTRGRASSSAQ